MNKSERLTIEQSARLALSRLLSTRVESKRVTVGINGPVHEFDIYSEGVVIGGVSTGTHKTSGGNANTGSCDRACAELLWLSLWPGKELRVHVLTDKALAEWLLKRFATAPFNRKINVYHFDRAADAIFHIGALGA